MRFLDPASLDFLATAPFRVDETHHFKAAPDAVFDAFADAELWPRFWPLMNEARWTHGTGGIGDEREVAIRGLGRFRERFIAWEPGARFAFTMIASTSPLAAQIVEDYRLSPDGSGTRLDWIVGVKPTTLGRATTPITRLVLQRMFRRGMPKLDRLLVAN